MTNEAKDSCSFCGEEYPGDMLLHGRCPWCQDYHDDEPGRGFEVVSEIIDVLIHAISQKQEENMMNSYEVTVNLWMYDPESNRTHARQTMDALDSKPTKRAVIRMLAPSRGEVMNTTRHIYGRDNNVLQWEFVSIKLIRQSLRKGHIWSIDEKGQS